MSHFERLADGIDVAPLLAQIAAHPELWDLDHERTDFAGSPHAEASDIWLRCRPRREIDHRVRFAEPHFPEFYPAWHVLTAAHPIVFDLMRHFGATSLGFTMLSRMPPGSVVLPHTDRGWHADHFSCKAYVILKANDQCINSFPDGDAIMRPGECWAFENRVPHSVKNGGDTERLALIVTMRTA